VFETRKDDVLWFSFSSFPTSGRVHHAIFARQGGVSLAPFASLNMSMAVPDERDRVYANRRRAFGIFGRDTATTVHAHMVHGATVARVTQANNGTWVTHVDGLVTNEPGCALAMSFADCAPIFLFDPANNAIGLGHAGWRGTVEDLPGAMVRKMTAEFGSDPADLIAGIGPSIGRCCYEVDEPVIGMVNAGFAEPESLLVPPPSKTNSIRVHPRWHSRMHAASNDLKAKENGRRPHFDLPEANRRNLANAGVKQIELSGLCTACRTDLFFSHRAENGRTGRFGTILILN
jgi:YfiH family protein